jgi:hypothetical protein
MSVGTKLPYDMLDMSSLMIYVNVKLNARYVKLNILEILISSSN